jgi:hypothetical protein
MVKNSRTHEGKVFVEFSTQTCFIKPFDDIFDMKIGRTVAGEFTNAINAVNARLKI